MNNVEIIITCKDNELRRNMVTALSLKGFILDDCNPVRGEFVISVYEDNTVSTYQFIPPRGMEEQQIHQVQCENDWLYLIITL